MQILSNNKNFDGDIINIVNTSYSPLNGPLRQSDFNSVLDNMRLTNGSPWGIPIAISITKDEYNKLKSQDRVELVEGGRRVVLKDIEVYPHDKARHARSVYGTLDNRTRGWRGFLGAGTIFWAGILKRLKALMRRPGSFF